MTAEILTDLSHEDYHSAEVTDTPCLSSSIAHILCTQSPAHARAAHPALNPDFERVEDVKFDLGNVVHALLLQGIDRAFVVHGYDDWKKVAAREARDEARREGKIPMLAHQREAVDAMMIAVSAQLIAHEADPPLFQDGAPETTLRWDEDGITCKARLDWLRHDVVTIDDLKTTSRSAHPDAYARNLFSVGGDIQAAFYLRGVRAVLPNADPTFRWCVVETHPPYALSVITPGPDVLALAEAKVEWAIKRWRLCLEQDYWASYGTDVHRAELPAWEEARWLEREAREEMAA